MPGNHDVERGVADDVVEQIRTRVVTLDAILQSPTDRERLLSRQSKYKVFADGFAQRELNAWKEIISIDNFGDIVLLGINTALVSSDDKDMGQLVLCGEQRSQLSSDGGRVRLVLTHHPFEDGWIGDEQSIRSLARRVPTIHLCGHEHDPRVDLTASAGGLHHVRIVAAAAHRDPKEATSGKDSHGYNFASLMVNAEGDVLVRTWPRRWFPRWSGFRVDHLGVPDRRFFDDKPLGLRGNASGLVLESTGTAGIHWWGGYKVQWKDLLYGKSTLDVFGISVSMFFDHPDRDHLKSFLQRGGKMRVVLADPRRKVGMARYDEDFEKPLGDRSSKVLSSLRQLGGLRKELAAPNALEIYVTPFTFKYSAYRLDGEIMFVPYQMTPGKRTINTPAFVLEESSPVVSRFFGPDLDALLDRAESLDDNSLDAILAAEAR